MFRAIQTAAVFSALTLPALLFGQNVSVDEGAFRLTVNGEVVGREEFSIRRVGRGSEARLILRGTVDMDSPQGHRTLAPAMEATGAEMAVTAYQVKVTGSRASEIYVTLSGRRYMAKVISARGEEVREFRAGPGSILLDRDVAHQYFLLLPFLDRSDAVSLTVLSPVAGEQTRLTFRRIGEEEVRIGTQLIQGRHYRLEGGADSGDVWFDEQGRVLKVTFPSRGYLAERESLG
ncbi:MAG: DUF6134 family protein [Gemmatimonadota bacterium]|jgi:hypothetical protein